LYDEDILLLVGLGISAVAYKSLAVGNYCVSLFNIENLCVMSSGVFGHAMCIFLISWLAFVGQLDVSF